MNTRSQSNIIQIIKKLEKIDNIIIELEKKIYTEALFVQQEIDKILEGEKEIFELGFTTKTELLKTKAKAFFNLGDLEKAEEAFNEIEKYTIEKINFSDDEKMNNLLKQKELIKNSTEKLSLYIENTWLVFKKDKEKTLIIDENKVKLFEQYFENEIEKLEKYKNPGVGIYYFGLFYSILGDSKKALEKIEDAALLGNKEAIETYTTMVMDIFLHQLELENDKESFIDNNLENIEEVLFQFIDDYRYSKKGYKQELIQGGNKYLYEKVGDFYSKIGKFSEALDSYNSGIQTGFKKSYLLFGKIAELYKKYKYTIKTFDIKNIDKIIIDNYKYQLNNAELSGDVENTALSLEKLGDLSEDKEKKYKYYHDSLNVLINSPYYFEGVEKIIYRIMNKGDIKSFSIKNEKGTYTVNQFDVINKITTEDTDYLILLASKYEEEGNIEYAFYNYLQAYQLKTENSKDALSFFIDTSIRDFIKKEKEEYKIKQELLNRILKKVDKNEILERESISILFNLITHKEFYENFNINNFNVFLKDYKNAYVFSDIFLHTILENIFSMNGTNMKSEEVKKLLRKIYSKKELKENDLELIYNLLNLGIETDKNDFEYTDKLRLLWIKSIK